MSRAFAAWMGPACMHCGLPALLHGAQCDDARDQKLLADALERDPLTGTCSPAGGARHAPFAHMSCTARHCVLRAAALNVTRKE